MFVKMLIIIAIPIFIWWIAISFQKWDDKKTGGSGCAAAGMILTLIIWILCIVGMFKSCIVDADYTPSYDYYDDIAKLELKNTR